MDNVTLKINHSDKWLDEAKEFNEKFDDARSQQFTGRYGALRLVGVPTCYLLIRNGAQTEHPIGANTDEFRELSHSFDNIGFDYSLERSVRQMTVYHHVDASTQMIIFPHAEELADWQVVKLLEERPAKRDVVFLYDETPEAKPLDRYFERSYTLAYS